MHKYVFRILSPFSTRSGLLLAPLAGALWGSAAPAQIFQIATHLPPYSQAANDVVDTRDCGYATVGTQIGVGFSAVLLNLFDSNGAEFNSSTYNQSSIQSAGYTLVEARAGGYILGAESGANATLGKWIIRTDAATNLVWSKFLPGTAFHNSPERVLGVSVYELDDQSIVSVNRVLNFGNIPFGGVLSRQTPNGTPVFTKVYNTFDAVAGRLITDFADVRTLRTPTAQPDLIVVGNTRDTSGIFRAVAIRFDVTGAVIWARSYSLSDTNIFADSVVCLPDGNVVFCGRRGAYVPGQQDPTDMIVAKIDSAAGAVLWAKSVDKFQPGFQAIRFDPTDQDVVIAGTLVTVSTGGPPVTTRSASLIKFTAAAGGFDGAELYSLFSPGKYDTGNGVTYFTPWGGFNLVGGTNTFVSPGNQLLMVKTYTTLISGCRETNYSPPVAPVALSTTNLPLEITSSTQSATPQVLSTPVHQLQAVACFTTRCIFDFNGDGIVDDPDFVIFAAAYDALICPTDPRFSCCPADYFTLDGLVDDFDFVYFAFAYDELVCP